MRSKSVLVGGLGFFLLHCSMPTDLSGADPTSGTDGGAGYHADASADPFIVGTPILPRLPHGFDAGTSFDCVRNPMTATSFTDPKATPERIAKYECPSCQGGAGATPSDRLSGSGALANPVVQLIFWGTDWDPNLSNYAMNFKSALQTVLASSYFDGLKQYGFQSIRLDQTRFDLGNDPPNPFGQGDISGHVFSIIDETSVYSNRDTNWIYLVITPPNVAHPKDACGAHGNAIETNWLQVNTANVAWVSFTDTNSMVENATHELVEAITDPDNGTGWLMNRVFPGGPNENEIGDACNAQADFVDGVLVQSYWSNADKACIIPYSVPSVTRVSPISGPVGSLVTITGTNLGPGLTVNVGGVAATSVTCPSSTSCTAVIAPSTPIGPHALTVANTEVSGSGSFCVSETACSPGQCGTMNDGCGGKINCGGCGAGQQCGGPLHGSSPTAVSVPNVCVPSCTPIGTGTILSSTECGEVNDWCGGTVLAGCESGQQCINGACLGTPGPVGPTCGNNVCGVGDTCVNGVCQGPTFGACHTAAQCCSQNGGTWAGGRCS